LHCTAVGKALLAALPDEQVTSIVNRRDLPSFTSATITDPEVLHNELIETRKRGYSLDRGEHEENVYCIGAPIFDHRGRGFAACSVSGIDPEIVRERRVELSALLIHTTQEISRRMGYVPARLSSLTSIPTA
jgi:DNA-binding IclR family transcriptional regulator